MTEKEVPSETNGENKTEEEDKDETELEKAIIHQVEYYFGDMNLVRDKFLREQVKLDEGWVPLDVLISFNRLAKLTTNLEVIAKALNKSTSGLLEVSEDNKKVRRSPEMPLPEMNEERRKEVQSRTVYAKGFPKDSLLDPLLNYFKEQGDDVETVIMRRYLDKQSKKKLFKGSVFVTFKTKESAEKFLEKKDLKYGEVELLRMWQDDYMKMKIAEYVEKKEKKDKKVKEKSSNEKDAKEDFKLPTGTVFKFSEGHDTMKREHVKEALEAIGAEIAYIDFKVGDSEGWVRLAKENQAIEINEKLTDGKLKIGESDVVFKLLEGDEEKSYLEKSVEEMVKRRKYQKNYNKGRNFKGKQGGRKRKQDHHEDAPQAKVKADS